MNLEFDSTGSLDEFRQCISRLGARDDVKGLMVLACDANDWSAAELDPVLKSAAKPVFGGIFPQIIHGRRNHERGTLVIGLRVKPEVISVHGLSDAGADFDAQIEECAGRWQAMCEAEGDGTLVVFMDGLSKRIAALVQSLFFQFGLEQNFIGGGAGSLSFEQKPCVITPRGVIADAAVIARLPVPGGVGVAHGWEPISEGIKVTAADGNLIKTLEWRPAFEVYRELVEADSGRVFGGDNFFDIAKGYPFGIGKLGTELTVRDPLMTDADGGLVCVGEVPQGCFVKILKGTPRSLVAAAARARELAEISAREKVGGEPAAFFIDCISRVLFLGEGIAAEFEAASAGRPLFGALTLGEIANNGRDYLEFYNKTAVMGLLEI